METKMQAEHQSENEDIALMKQIMNELIKSKEYISLPKKLFDFGETNTLLSSYLAQNQLSQGLYIRINQIIDSFCKPNAYLFTILAQDLLDNGLKISKISPQVFTAL